MHTLRDVFQRLHLLPRALLQNSPEDILQLLVARLEQAAELGDGLLVGAQLAALEVHKRAGRTVE
jgi:hypothetical protein